MIFLTISENQFLVSNVLWEHHSIEDFEHDKKIISSISGAKDRKSRNLFFFVRTGWIAPGGIFSPVSSIVNCLSS